MADTAPTSEISTRGPRLQFSLFAALVAMTAVSVFLSCYVWLGKDGLALAAVVAPAISIPFLAKGPVTHKAQMTLAAILLTFGITWSIMFPKSWDVLSPYTFTSILIGVGLIGGGLLLRGKRFGVMLLCTLLLWSVLLNLSLYNHFYTLASVVRRQLNLQPAAGLAADVFAEALLFHDEGDLDKAIACYTLALELNPRPVVYLHRAEARLKNGDPAGALTDCDAAIQLDPTDATSYRMRGKLHKAMGDETKAAADLEKAVELGLDPEKAGPVRFAR